MSFAVITEEPIGAPFVVLIDTAEGAPWLFQNIHADHKGNYLPIAVPTRRECLGRHPNSLGDYSTDTLFEIAHVERKSIEDIQGTVLGWETGYQKEKDLPSRRDRFKAELENLSKIPYGCVIVEGTRGQCLTEMPEWGSKGRELNAKIFARSIIAFQQDFSCQWFFCDTRRLAEVTAFRWLFRAHKKIHGKVRI